MPGERRIFAGVSGSPGSVHALATRPASPTSTMGSWSRCWPGWPPGGNLNERKDPCPELRQLWQDQAW
jgi:hypothetical protein